MSTLQNQLRVEDPLRLEPMPDGSARERVRATMLEAASAQPGAARHRSTRSIVMPWVAIVAVAALAYVLWPRAATPVFAAVRFEVHLAEEQPAPGLIVAQIDDSGRLLYLHPEVIVDNADVARASVSQAPDGRFDVSVEFSSSAVRRLTQATAAHLGRPLAIVLDGDVVLAPTIRGPIGRAAVITGDYSRGEAERIANGIAPR